MVKKRGTKNSSKATSKTKSKKKSNHHSKKEPHPIKHEHHPVFREPLSLGQRAADGIARFGGSWTFILLFGFFLVVWMGINTWVLVKRPFDPYPYILLNLVLSCLAAIQAPIILMTQNRQAERDRIDAKYDHAINRKSERQNRSIIKDLDRIKVYLRDIKKKK